MTYREAIAWLAIEPRHAAKTIAGFKQVSAGSVDLGSECTLPDAMRLAEAYPNHDRVLVIRMKPNEGKPRVHVLGKWDGRMQDIASAAVKVAVTLFYRAMRLGLDHITFRTMPTAEEIKAAHEEDKKKALRKARSPSTAPVASEKEVASEAVVEPEPQSEVTSPGVISPEEAELNDLNLE